MLCCHTQVKPQLDQLSALTPPPMCIQAELKELEEAYANGKADLAKLAADAAQTEQDVAAAEKQVAMAELELEKISTQVATLSSQEESLQAEVEALKKVAASLDAQIEQVRPDQHLHH